MAEQNELPNTTKALYDLLALSISSKTEELDASKLRYVLYARKSTTGDERQETSIPDQVNNCKKRVVELEEPHLNVVRIIEEKCSAKVPGIRDEFNDMMDDVRAGKIDGIICWHPDRLSRNMKEAGDIIDLLDRGELKDLRFATYTFENNPTGKMLLGISFVLSKQYSEHLSESVTRGNISRTEHGRYIGKFKHGYTINFRDELHPDGHNFAIVKQAFERRLNGESQPEIVKWLNTTRYQVHKRQNIGTPEEPDYVLKHSDYKWDKDAVSKLFRDPVNAGVLKYGDGLCELGEIYDFTPIISVEEFFKINKIKDFNSPKIMSAIMANKREDTKADLLRGIVCCGYCSKPFGSGLTPKMLKAGQAYYYLYRCESEGCKFKGKSVRAKIMLDYAFKFFDEHVFTTKENYEAFLVEAKEYSTNKSKQVNSHIMSLSRLVGDKQKEYDRTKTLITGNKELAKHYNLDQILAEKDELQSELNKLTKEREALKVAPVTYAKYLELFENISVKLENTHDIAILDNTLRKFFSNFTIKSVGAGKEQRCEITHKLNEPWEGFVKSGNFVTGRG